MQNKSNHIRLKKQRSSSIKAGLHTCLLLVLAVLFSWQQFSAFAYVSGSIKEPRSVFHQEHITANAQISSHFPFDSTPIGQTMEMEVAEEDETKNEIDECSTAAFQKYSSEELFYTASLSSRFLQLTSAIHNRPTVPFFILHHSWKSYLS